MTAASHPLPSPDMSPAEREWWTEWWKEDGFTWGRLANTRIKGESLQDFWRKSPGRSTRRTDEDMGDELVRDPDGALWHIAYVPMFWRDGTPAKAAWSDARHADLSRLLNAWLAWAADRSEPLHLWRIVVGGTDVLAPRLNAVMHRCYVHGRFELPAMTARSRIESCYFRGKFVIMDAHFEGGRDLTFNHFRGGLIAFRSRFDGDADFHGSSFGGSHFNFMQIGGELNFDSCRFAELYVETSRLSGQVLCGNTVFAGAANFWSTRFGDRVSFLGSRFGGAVSFAGSEFSDMVQFSGTSWSDDLPSGGRPVYESAFSRARFKGTADFQGSGFGQLSRFDGAVFDGAVLIDDVGDKAAKAGFREELKVAIAGGEERLEALRGGCHRLRQAMERASDKRRETLLYQFELRTRRHQGKYPRWERAFSYFYGWAGDYGASIGRPIGALFASLILFGLVYALIGGFTAGTLGLDRPLSLSREALAPVFEGVSYSAGRAFPFGPWAVEGADPFRQALTGDGSTLASVLVRLLATFQSILSGVLLFLSAMSVRRRFQIG